MVAERRLEDEKAGLMAAKLSLAAKLMTVVPNPGQPASLQVTMPGPITGKIRECEKKVSEAENELSVAKAELEKV